MASAGLAPQHDPAESFTLNGVPGDIVLAEKEGQEIEKQRQGAIGELKHSVYKPVLHGVRKSIGTEHNIPGKEIDREGDIAELLADPGIPVSETMKEYKLSLATVGYIKEKYGIIRKDVAPEPVGKPDVAATVAAVLAPMAAVSMPALVPATARSGFRGREERIVAMLRQGMKYSEVANAEGLTIEGVEYHARKNRLGRRDAVRRRNALVLADLRNGILTTRQIATKHCISVSSVYLIASKNNLRRSDRTIRPAVAPETAPAPEPTPAPTAVLVVPTFATIPTPVPVPAPDHEKTPGVKAVTTLSELVVEDNIPLSPLKAGRGAVSKYQIFFHMKVGQSVFVPESVAPQRKISTISKLGKIRGMSFALRTECNGGVHGTRVWRVK